MCGPWHSPHQLAAAAAAAACWQVAAAVDAVTTVDPFGSGHTFLSSYADCCCVSSPTVGVAVQHLCVAWPAA